MNKIYKNIVFAAAILVSASSCNDVLDLNDTSTFGDISVWSSQANADAYVTAAYKTFSDQSNVFNDRSEPNNVKKRFYDSYSDLMKSNWWWVEPYNRALMETSAFSSGNAGMFDCWNQVYGRIKRTNMMLNDLERYGQKWGEEWYTIRRAEGRFCNAINYFFLARVYGGVVLRTDHSGGGGWLDDGAYEQDKHRARISEAETYKYILDELQWCAENLPESWPAAWEGRATKGIAYAFISRIALYAHEWKLAAEAAEECAKYYDLVPDYAELFDVNSAQDNSKEIIFSIKGAKNVIKHSFDAENRPYGDRAVYNAQTQGYNNPTAELVDMYEYKDGTKFDWNTWQDVEYTDNDGNVKKLPDPYTNREPRFYATILYNGAQWEGRTIRTYVGGSDEYKDFSVETDADGHTVTGYYLRKYLQEGNTTFVAEGSYNTDIVIRYGEVLLNKAEALAQSGNIPDALVALNKVRTRVGLPSKTMADAQTLDAFMTLLRHERCVELAGEGLRIWDLRRWRLAENVINGKNAHGHKITRQSDGTFKYETVDVDAGRKRIFPSHYYYLSLPTSELSQNNLCENNPVW